MLTSVAFVVCQVRVVDWPLSSVFGFADSEAVGAVGAGGGVGGGGATFFAHAPRNMIVPSANTRVLHLVIVAVILIACFTEASSFLCARMGGVQSADSRQGALSASRKTVLHFSKLIYFQLQLGCVLPPLEVNCLTLVPSASMVQIWSLPERWD